VFENPARWDNFHFADEICIGPKLFDLLFVDSEAVGFLFSLSCVVKGSEIMEKRKRSKEQIHVASNEYTVSAVETSAFSPSPKKFKPCRSNVSLDKYSPHHNVVPSSLAGEPSDCGLKSATNMESSLNVLNKQSRTAEKV